MVYVSLATLTSCILIINILLTIIASDILFLGLKILTTYLILIAIKHSTYYGYNDKMY